MLVLDLQEEHVVIDTYVVLGQAADEVHVSHDGQVRKDGKRLLGILGPEIFVPHPADLWVVFEPAGEVAVGDDMDGAHKREVDERELDCHLQGITAQHGASVR